MSKRNGGRPWSRVEDVIAELRAGRMVVVLDDERRENEGDLIVAAEAVTAEHMRFMAKKGSGLICMVMEPLKAMQLGLSLQTGGESGKTLSPFMQKIDAREGITTGISAADRAHTIRTAAGDDCGPQDLIRGPGHVDTLCAQPGGVLVRPGHTEAGADLARLAGFSPMATVCEIIKDDGTMARADDLRAFCAEHGLKMCTINELVAYRRAHEVLVTTHSTTRLPTAQGAFTLRTYHSALSGETHCALVAGDLLDNPPGDEPVLVRVHSECLTGDAFGSQRCDCGQQLQTAMARVQQEQRGAVLYMRQEGRGIGLAAKMQAYVLQDQGLDTVEANHQLGYAADPRDYAVAAQMLSDLGIQRVRLLTNNPEKVEQLERCGIEVVERISIESEANAHNSRYLQTKREKMGHLLTGLEE